MNLSSLSFFEESSVWDPKIIRQRLCITQDDLNKLNSIPDWIKDQNNYRADKDLSIGNSQSQRLVSLSQNDVRIKQNTDLFDEHLQNRKSILKRSKEYTDKLTRCISLLDIHKVSEDTLSSFPLKRALSLSALYHQSNISKDYSFDKGSKSSKHHLSSHSKESLECRLTENTTASGENKTVVPKSDRSEVLFCDKISSRIMEVVSQLPMNISTHVEIVTNSNFETAKENDELLTEHTKNSVDELVVSVTLESLKNENLSKADEVRKLPESPAPFSCKNNEDGLVTVEKNSTNVNSAFEDAKMNSNIQEAAETRVLASSVNGSTLSLPSEIVTENVVLPVDDVNGKRNMSGEELENDESMKGLVVKEAKPHATSDQSTVSKMDVVHVASSVSVASDKMNLHVHELEKNKLVECLETSAVSMKEQCISKENVIFDNKDANEICSSSNKKVDAESIQNHFEKNGTDKNISSLEAGISGKRKFESKNKKSKKHKSEEKQSNIKIRSIKKVGEVCYCIEDVKTMLDIIKQFS